LYAQREAMMGRIVKLTMTSENNNNKYYNMTELGDGTFEAHYGRVGATGVREIYPMSSWDKKYKEKLKGKKDENGVLQPYRDITDLLSVEKTDDTGAKAEDQAPVFQGMSREAMALIDFLQSCAKGVVKQNYTVKVADVTQKQVDAAQAIVDQLAALSQGAYDEKAVNKVLLDLYNTIPRKMSDTRKFLLQAGEAKDRLQKMIAAEQDLLDAMAGQVQTAGSTTKTDTGTVTKLDITIRAATQDEIAELKKTTDLDFTKVGSVYRVENERTRKAFDAIPETKVVMRFHGSRNENYWNIINGGIKIKPAGAIQTGSMLGQGAYWADRARKSIGYTSIRGSYWASGTSGKAYLGIFEVKLGKEWDLIGPGKRYESWMSGLNKAKVNDKGFDSIYAKGGADLVNSEWVTFEENRSTIKYLIELKA